MKKLGRNIGYMTLSQAANYVLPLVTLPYITRIIGPENYGLVEFATVTILFLSAIVTYGFTFTGTRKVAELKDNFPRISKVFSTLIQAKLYLLLIASIIFGLLLLGIPQYRIEWHLMLFAFPYVIGWGLYPDFLFQGRQDLGIIAMVTTAIKVLGAVLIFALIHEESDYFLVVGINGITQIVAALITMLYIPRKYPWLKFSWQSNRLIKAYLKSGFFIFLSHFFTRLFTFGSILFIGFLLPQKELGLFAAALKLITVGQSFLFTPLGNSLYPYLASKAKNEFGLYLKERKRFLFYLLGISSLATIMIIAAKEFWVKLLFGEDYLQAAPALAIMAPAMLLTTLSHFSMKQGLMVLKADGLNLRVFLIVGTSSLFLNYFLIEFYGFIGAAWAKLALEFLLAALGMFYFYKVSNRMLKA